MFQKIKPYMGGYIKYTYAALCVMFLALIASAVPFFMVYRIIAPLLDGEMPSVGYFAVHITVIFICELVYAILYVQGLRLSHISAYHTLKNIRISLQKKLAKSKSCLPMISTRSRSCLHTQFRRALQICPSP